MPGLFVTGTDTGVGKTVVAAAICATLRARGVAVAARKPVLSGLDDPGPHDHELLAACTGERPQDVAPRRFGPPVSPHLAAELAGERLEIEELARLPQAEAVVVEGVGGLLVPLGPGPGATVRDLAVAVGLPLVVVARPGLGTINHTLLTVEAARAAGLDVRGIVLTPWPSEPSVMERSNRETIGSRTGVGVHVLPAIELVPAALAAAGSELPIEEWLG